MTRNAKGFTLAELLTAMMVMSIISLAVLSLTMALTTAQEYSEDFYRHVQIARNSLRRIERDINKANLITTGDADTLVYWEDTNGNGDIELRELRMITTDLATGKVMLCYAKFPVAWPQTWIDQWDDAMTVALATDLTEAVSWIKNVQWAAEDALATEVTSLKFTVSSALPTAEMVQIEIKVGSGPGAVELRSTASMRAHKIADLYQDAGTYFLAAPE
jgi:prepilin-type N-terminal cleavage/methylation domain-containing protein